MISRRDFLIRSLASSAGLVTSPYLSAALLPKTDVRGYGNGYGRLFPARPAAEPGSIIEEGLTELGRRMRDDDGDAGRGIIPAGYTYLGQFLDHDLTLDITPLDQARKNPGQITNFRTPFLDLDHLYGGGPNISPFLYRKHGSDSPEGAERFLVGTTIPGDVSAAKLASSCNDLPRNWQGVALVGDAREDENLILAQLHVAFLKLHNLVLDRPELLRGLSQYEVQPPFEAARRVVTWHYQWLIRHDFLRTILDPEIFQFSDNRRSKPTLARPSTEFRIPVEFNAAAFRFGHSMVRNRYLYNDFHLEVKLGEDLFQRTGFGKAGNVPLPQDWVINWKRFFTFPVPDSFDAQPARKIDARIAEGLFHLSSTQIRAFNTPSSSRAILAPELTVRTLLRGARLGLPSGEEAAREIKRRIRAVRILREDEIVSGPGGTILTDPKYDLRGNTPLWYYILKEAEVLQQGSRLGPVGSYIVGDVILAALAADPNSYVRVAGPTWTPTLWVPELKKNPLEEMSKMLKLVAPDRATKSC